MSIDLLYYSLSMLHCLLNAAMYSTVLQREINICISTLRSMILDNKQQICLHGSYEEPVKLKFTCLKYQICGVQQNVTKHIKERSKYLQSCHKNPSQFDAVNVRPTAELKTFA